MHCDYFFLLGSIAYGGGRNRLDFKYSPSTGKSFQNAWFCTRMLCHIVDEELVNVVKKTGKFGTWRSFYGIDRFHAHGISMMWFSLSMSGTDASAIAALDLLSFRSDGILYWRLTQLFKFKSPFCRHYLYCHFYLNYFFSGNPSQLGWMSEGLAKNL